MKQRIRELDGVRGIAILLVFAAHLLDGVWPHDRKLLAFVPHGGGGGFSGVQLFFALSGYLITSILLDEIKRTDRLDFRGFYVRRARRLLPALLGACAIYGVYACFLAPPGGIEALGAIARALTYTTNLHPLWGAVPDSRWLAHCWSLAVEEQFYLLWPPVLLFTMRRGQRGAVLVVFVVIVATVALRLVPRLAGISYEVLRWDALMAGALLAIVKPRIPAALRWVGAIVLAYYTLRRGGDYTTWDYLVSAVGAALFVDLALHTTFCRDRVLVYFGKISYGLYLWHVLLMRFDVSPWIAGPASVIVAELSHRFLEARFLAPRAPQPATKAQKPVDDSQGIAGSR